MASEQPKEHYQYLKGITVCIGNGCEICADIEFIRWIDKVKRVLVVDCKWTECAVCSIDEDAWREMFNEGLSVQDAICEEFSG